MAANHDPDGASGDWQARRRELQAAVELAVLEVLARERLAERAVALGEGSRGAASSSACR